MRLLIIGAVAAGTSAAAEASRNDDKAEIVIYEKDKDISYSGCGLPFYIGGEVDYIKELEYSPPFATVKDAIHYTGMLLDNSLNKNDDGV